MKTKLSAEDEEKMKNRKLSHPDVQLPVALNAHVDPKQFILHYNELCRINNFFFRFGLRNGTLILKLTETTNGIDVVIPCSVRNKESANF